ncbi:MAG: type II toxin-antitoxin system PemK/MazF family toxin [Desulfamplus sp.]|nr:type II toxin-antitoxin system PemK/MazF family toxin [Desulfamplus sp.]
MTDYKFCDVVLVPFPFTDQTTSKKRPAVIVSSNEYNQRRPDVIIMAITSQMLEVSQMHTPGFFGDLPVRNWQDAGLVKPSMLKPILTTIAKNLILKRLGTMMDSDRIALVENLQRILGVF